MPYALYKNAKKIRKTRGNPRRRGIIVWDVTKKGVKSWIREYGTLKQKKLFLKKK